jgi:hypothetical protein
LKKKTGKKTCCSVHPKVALVCPRCRAIELGSRGGKKKSEKKIAAARLLMEKINAERAQRKAALKD